MTGSGRRSAQRWRSLPVLASCAKPGQPGGRRANPQAVPAFDFRGLAVYLQPVHEIKNVRQERGQGRRRWFEAEGLELIVWLDAHDAVSGFQLCYDFGRGPGAVTWRSGSGFAHNVIDEGDDSPLKNLTPVLGPGEDAPWAEIAQLFDRHGRTLEPGLRKLVGEKLAEKAGDGVPRPRT